MTSPRPRSYRPENPFATEEPEGRAYRPENPFAQQDDRGVLAKARDWIARPFVQGASLGTSDEARGALSLPSPATDEGTPEWVRDREDAPSVDVRDRYLSQRDAERAALTQARADAPIISRVAELGGALATPIGTLGTVGKGASLGKRALQGAKAGAVLGGIAGTGYSEGEPGEVQDFADIVKAGAAGAAGGAALGAAAAPAVAGAQAVGRGVARLAGRPTVEGSRRAAVKTLDRALTRTGQTADDVAARSQRLSQVDDAIALDALGPAGREVVQGMTLPDAAAGEAAKVARARQAALRATPPGTPRTEQFQDARDATAALLRASRRGGAEDAGLIGRLSQTALNRGRPGTTLTELGVSAAGGGFRRAKAKDAERLLGTLLKESPDDLLGLLLGKTPAGVAGRAGGQAGRVVGEIGPGATVTPPPRTPLQLGPGAPTATDPRTALGQSLRRIARQATPADDVVLDAMAARDAVLLPETLARRQRGATRGRLRADETRMGLPAVTPEPPQGTAHLRGDPANNDRILDAMRRQVEGAPPEEDLLALLQRSLMEGPLAQRALAARRRP